VTLPSQDLTQSLADRLDGAQRRLTLAGVFVLAAHSGPLLSGGVRQSPEKRKARFGAVLLSRKARRLNELDDEEGAGPLGSQFLPTRTQPEAGLTLDFFVIQFTAGSFEATCDYAPIIFRWHVESKENLSRL